MALTLESRIAYLEAALKEISIGHGRYSRDPLERADNCIEDMKAVALKALDGTWTLPEEEEED